ncbi:MAG: hydroxymethylglutaryl-CoA reductase, partial [Candidatus Eremiobacteraeota bacterium]|nr:hydroxymethylglutaryl-CoA reductase [Candidatus Eremiobacteraeota bacterium]
ARAALDDPQTRALMQRYARNIENFIGTAKVPVGLAGPLRVNGRHAHGEYFVPLATTEAALVASYSRGAQLITHAGGCRAMVTDEGIARAPGFTFADLAEAAAFAQWVDAQRDRLREVAATTTRYGALQDIQTLVEGNHAYLRCTFSTGEAAGQNMATIATAAICRHILAHAPVAPRYHFVEANFSGDKKATVMSLLGVRGRRATAEIELARALVRDKLHADVERIAEYWRMGAIGTAMSGSIGIHGHYANGLAALFIACGQDAACVAEAAIGISRLEATPAGDLYAAVTLPNLVVGTVGGGTGLPTQSACLEILGLRGPSSADAFAEVCAGLCLAGELSITSALCADEFTAAHERLARRGKAQDQRAARDG